MATGMVGAAAAAAGGSRGRRSRRTKKTICWCLGTPVSFTEMTRRRYWRTVVLYFCPGWGMKLWWWTGMSSMNWSSKVMLLCLLMWSRYDIRNRLEDKSQFGLKSNLPVRLTREEEEFERQLEEERYLFLGKDVLEEELLEGVEHTNMTCSGVCACSSWQNVSYAYVCMVGIQLPLARVQIPQLMYIHKFNFL